MRFKSDDPYFARKQRRRRHRIKPEMGADIEENIAGRQMTVEEGAGREFEPGVFGFELYQQGKSRIGFIARGDGKRESRSPIGARLRRR